MVKGRAYTTQQVLKMTMTITKMRSMMAEDSDSTHYTVLSYDPVPDCPYNTIYCRGLDKMYSSESNIHRQAMFRNEQMKEEGKKY